MTEKKPADPTAEQLLKSLDMRLEELRKRREGVSQRRGSFRVIALVMIVFCAAVALSLLLYLIEQMRMDAPQRAVPVEAR